MYSGAHDAALLALLFGASLRPELPLPSRVMLPQSLKLGGEARALACLAFSGTGNVFPKLLMTFEDAMR